MNLNNLNDRWFSKMDINITEENKERLALMKGCEVNSIEYENCVYINSKFEVIDGGEVVDTLDTNKKIDTIWEEFAEQELGGFDFI
tara:strand:+ start:83 stop:340 length:258 start_codon:yes stop_codon:yes gene_type:complete